MKRKILWKRIAWIAGIAFVIFMFVGITLAGRGVPPPPPIDQPIMLYGATVQNHRINTKSWSFDYKDAQLSPDGQVGTVDGVRNGILFRKGKPYMKISAEHVSINTQTLDFSAIGKVHIEQIKDVDKHAFDTDLVDWTNGAKSLLMPHPSYFYSDGQALKVKSISVDFAKDQIHLSGVGGAFSLKK